MEEKYLLAKKTFDKDHDNKINQIDELIDSNLSLFSKRIPADLEQTKSLAWLLLARKELKETLTKNID